MNNYRLVASFPLRPVFTSLGLGRELFRAPDGGNPAPFDAGVNCGPAHPDCIWLFRGGDCFRFNLRTGKIEDGPTSIGDWGGPSWPPLYATGLDAAVWAGPAYPDFHYFFKGNLVIRLNRAVGVDRGPKAMIADGWGSLAGTPLADRIDVAFHDVRADHLGCVHLVRDGITIEHSLNTGGRVGGPQPLSSLLSLPEAFASGADVAFFGAGMDAETLFLFKGRECCAIRFADLSVSRTAPIEEIFPGLAPYIPTPQLFMVEDYQMSTYCGEVQRGALVDRININPRTKSTVILVTERTTSSTSTFTESILESTSEQTSRAFYDDLQQRTEDESDSESYAYRMAAQAHGDASADSLWGGEVNLSANVQGGSNDNRQRLAQSTLQSVGSQVNQANQQLSQRAVGSRSDITDTARVVSTKEEEVDNSGSDHPISIELYQTIQPYLSILSLVRGRIAYVDGRSPSQIRDLSQIDELLDGVLADPATAGRVKQALLTCWSKVSDYDDAPKSLLVTQDDGPLLRIASNLQSQYSFPLEDGSRQPVTVPGIAVAGDRYLVRVPSLIPVEADAHATAPPAPA